MIKKYDFSEVDYLDPSLLSGHRVIYDRNILTRIKYIDKFMQMKVMPNLENMNVRILQFGSNDQPTSIKLEIFCESDLFLCFEHEVTKLNFDEIRYNQNISVTFLDYAKICIKSLNNCIESNQKYLPILTINMDKTARLEIIQETEIKSISIIYFDLFAYDDEFIRQRIHYKYTSIRNKVIQKEERLSKLSLIN